MFGRCLRFSLVFLPLLVLYTAAFAHDSWISRGLHRNGSGEWCCGEGDCFVVPSDQVSMSATGQRYFSPGDDKPSLRRRGSFAAGKRFAEARDRPTEMALEPSPTPNR